MMFDLLFCAVSARARPSQAYEIVRIYCLLISLYKRQGRAAAAAARSTDAPRRRGFRRVYAVK